MLQSIRDNVRGWIAYVIVALLAIPFVTVGIYNYLTGGADPTVAEVEGTEISRAELDSAAQRYQAQLREALGDNYQQFLDTMDPGLIRRQQLEQLIQERVLQHYVRSRGMVVSDEAIRREIRSIPSLQTDGRFDNALYQRFLASQGFSSGQFEARVRQSLMLERLQSGVEASVVVSRAEMERAAAIEYQRRSFDWLLVDAALAGADIEISADDIEAYYEANPGEFERPEQVRVDYVELDREMVAESVALGEDELRARYEELRDTRYTDPERRSVRHVLIAADRDAGEAALGEARERAEAARERIAAGEPFADVAEDISDDPTSAAQGGDLGTLVRGDFGGDALEDAIFALEEGEISEPVQSDFGWHVLQVEGIEGGDVTPFEDVRDELRRQLSADRGDSRFFEVTNELANLAFENSDSLEPAARAVGATVRTSDWFSADSGDGVAAADAVRREAFSRDVLEQGYNSDLIRLGDDRVVVLRAVEQRPATVLPLEEVREQARGALQSRRSTEAAIAIADEVEAHIAEGADPASATTGRPEVSLETVSEADRRSDGIPRPVLERAFRLDRPDGDGPVLGRARIGADVAVIHLRDVRDGQLDELDAEARTQLAERLRQLEARSAWQELIASLRAAADVSIREDRIGTGAM